MEGTTQLTNWISWALDVVLDNLLPQFTIQVQHPDD